MGLLLSNHDNINELPLMLFAPGVEGHCNSKNVYARNNLLMYPKEYVHSFDFCDMTNRTYHQEQCDLGQNEDITTLAQEYTDLFTLYKKTHKKDPRIVLFGLCRGASTILKFAGLHKPTGIAAIVVESPYARIDDQIRYWYKFLPFSFKRQFFKFRYPKLDLTEKNTIDYVKDIDVNIPIALVCIKTDWTFPYQSTIELYNALIKSGHTKTHLLIIPKGHHARITDNPEYQSFVNAFYRRYNLPYNEQLADKGEKYFSNYHQSVTNLIANTLCSTIAFLNSTS